MTAIDTIVGHAANPSTTYTTVTMNTGDSASVRSFPDTSMARLERITRGGATSGAARVFSPLMHDGIRGITFTSSQNPAVYAMPQYAPQRVYPQDSLTIQVTGGTAETDLAALTIYYDSLPGSDARLHNWGDIQSLIQYIKPVEVDVTNSATIGAWTDTVITTTENILKANRDYAVLGYITDVAQSVVGIKGSETGNLRICGPGTTLTEDTSNYFIDVSMREGTPHIPVINSANAPSIFVSTADVVASSTPKVQLILALLSSNLPS
ncbi:MAG TPA: hypothetical protein VHT26_07690 [Trebonia sp.]|jgi:hypothetical protein|nr:hypothetical protein [Trebonia sp.]